MNSDGLLEMGDRVMKPGLAMKFEPPMYGKVTRVYKSVLNNTGPGVPLVDVEFDNGIVKQGFINGSGSLVLVPGRD